MKKRPLTAIEKTFVKEAEEGHFIVGYDAEGDPYAIGACETGNLFSMDVIEDKTAGDGPGTSCYFPRD